MLVISGETSWAGHLWALRLTPPMMWFRSAIGDFPLIGLSRHSCVEYFTPRPKKRDEIMIFGGVLEAPSSESQVINAFFTLDIRTWHATESEKPQITWAEVEAKMIAKGKEE
eukprot:5566845-Prymnesium_polylepis.1